MRRIALIVTGAAVAAVLILPAAAAWLRAPEAQPLPEPVQLRGSGESEQPEARAPLRRTPATSRAGARLAELAPAAAGRPSSTLPASDPVATNDDDVPEHGKDDAKDDAVEPDDSADD